MKHLAGFLLFLLFIPQSMHASEASDQVLIRNVHVVSVEGVGTQGTTDVLIQNGRIERISPDITASIANVIDGGGRFLTPGLIDSHTHLNEVPGMTFEHEDNYPEVSKAARTQIPRSYLFHGFTTVIDLNSSPDAIARWKQEPVRPTAYFCGAAPVVNGYPMSWMPVPARYTIMPYFLFDSENPDGFPEGFDPKDHSPDVIVPKIKKDGAICIKTHYERGFGGRGDLPVLSAELIQGLVDSANQIGMPVLLHANAQYAQAFGVEAGVNAFAHGMWAWDDHEAISLSPAITDIIDATIAARIKLQPTIQVLYGEQDIHNPDYLNDPRLKNVVPQNLLDWYTTEDGQWWINRMLNIPPIARLVEEGRWAELDEPPIKRVTTVLGYFAKNGGQLLFGSDTPSDPTFANPPGLNGRLEMNRWMEAGVTPRQLFLAATVNNSEFFGLDDLGSIEVGKQADLLLMEENPLESVNAYDTITHVILDGKVIERQALSVQQ